MKYTLSITHLGQQELKPNWLQQFRAIFTKRYLNFWRFKTGWVWLLILPAVFVAVGLSLAATIITHHVNDNSREMSLQASAPSSNITLFWGEFADDVGVPFSLKVSGTYCTYVCFLRVQTVAPFAHLL